MRSVDAKNKPPIAATAVVLAGGKGTRIAQLYRDLPKPMVPAAGRPFLYWVTAWLVAQGVRDIVYSIGYRAEIIEREAALWMPRHGVSLRCHSETRPLGTGGALLDCRDLCGDWLLVVNGDTLFFCDLARLVGCGAERGRDGAVAGVTMPDTSRYGALDIEDGLLRGFHEKRPGSGTVSGGIILLRKAILAPFLEGRAMSLESELLPELIGWGRQIAVMTSTAPFLDIGTPDTVAQADAFVTRHRAAFAGAWAAER